MSLEYNRTDACTNKQTITTTTKYFPINKSKNMELILCWPVTDHGVCNVLCLISPATLHLRKLIFPFANRYQLQIASFRGGTLCPPSPLSAGTPSPLNLCSLVHAVTVSVSSCVHQYCCMQKALFLWSHP